jgi:ribosome biogenesis GTPase / thiamine phosphate phosphatase
VGDYVLCRYNPLQGIGRIEKLLERKSSLLRKVAGEYAGAQVLGANLDTVFYLSSLNMDLNLRRMERYLIMIKDGGIRPVVILTKADLISSDDLESILERVRDVIGDISVYITSAKDLESFECLNKYLCENETVAFLGSSGVGKSTMTNIMLSSEECDVQIISHEDDKGKHTTTSRSLYQLENGCYVMDTPGIREIQLWEGESGLNETFKDIEDLIQNCGFRNCSHVKEPNCAILTAIDRGELCPLRFRSYGKLCREQMHMEIRANAKDLSQQKKSWKKRSMESRRGRQKDWKTQG